MEALRLCDLENLTQKEAGDRMGVSRGTVQRILTAARSKVADALVNGKALSIEGGPVEVAPPPLRPGPGGRGRGGPPPGRGRCRRRGRP